ncbi:MAG: hypothetical protein ACKOQX_05595 [Actinomycetota bacterium]
MGLSDAMQTQITAHHAMIKTETLAVELTVGNIGKGKTPNADLDGVAVFVAVNRVA